DVNLRVRTEVDNRTSIRRLQAMESVVNRLNGKTAEITVALRNGEKVLAQLRLIDGLIKDRTAKVRYDVDSAEAVRQAKALDKALNDAGAGKGGTRPDQVRKIKADADIAAADAKLKVLSGTARSLSRLRPTITV